MLKNNVHSNNCLICKDVVNQHIPAQAAHARYCKTNLLGIFKKRSNALAVEFVVVLFSCVFLAMEV